jgi:hypothetical protein
MSTCDTLGYSLAGVEDGTFFPSLILKLTAHIGPINIAGVELFLSTSFVARSHFVTIRSNASAPMPSLQTRLGSSPQIRIVIYPVPEIQTPHAGVGIVSKFSLVPLGAPQLFPLGQSIRHMCVYLIHLSVIVLIMNGFTARKFILRWLELHQCSRLHSW